LALVSLQIPRRLVRFYLVRRRRKRITLTQILALPSHRAPFALTRHFRRALPRRTELCYFL
jgi:hypothetical protein